MPYIYYYVMFNNPIYRLTVFAGVCAIIFYLAISLYHASLYQGVISGVLLLPALPLLISPFWYEQLYELGGELVYVRRFLFWHKKSTVKSLSIKAERKYSVITLTSNNNTHFDTAIIYKNNKINAIIDPFTAVNLGNASS
ncbi:MAG: hypothetical protein GJ680_18665 [Alteromonadaceae bacterium]|nr:hypothetical protein [Alteromonadaceae bacterium]